MKKRLLKALDTVFSKIEQSEKVHVLPIINCGIQPFIIMWLYLSVFGVPSFYQWKLQQSPHSFFQYLRFSTLQITSFILSALQATFFPYVFVLSDCINKVPSSYIS